MPQRIQLRRGTASEWNLANPVLGAGELGIEEGLGSVKIKVGDGVSTWDELDYFATGTATALTAADVLFVPVGTIGSTNLQTALAEVASEGIAALAAESANRISEDDDEALARIAGDDAEATTRAAAIAALSGIYVPKAGAATTIDTAIDFTTAPTINGEPIGAGGSATAPTVLENAAGTAGLNVQHGLFWPTGIDLGHFLVEAWVCFLGTQSGYWLAEGYGGSHAILAGWNGDLTAGNIFDGSTNVSWSGNYHWQVGEWGRATVGWDGAYIWVYVNGVPCGRTPFVGPRRAGQGWFDTGGSDHSNMKARLAQIRVFEGANPMETGGKASSYVMPPARHFSKAWISGDGVSESAFAQALYDFTTLDTIIPDQGEGFGGRLHPGVMSNPPLQRVSDPTAPFGNNAGTARTRVPQAPLAVPAGWKIYDSVGRADSIPEFTAAPVPGSTEGGTLGAKAYLGTDTWGVFNGGLVCLTSGGAGGRWVANDSPNFDVRWRREIAFDAIGDIAGQFRVNTAGTTGFRIFTIGDDLRMYRPDGSQLAMTGLPTTWLWKRVVTAGTSIIIYVDNGAGGWTQVGTDTSSLNQTEVGVGPYSDGSHGNAGRVEEWGVAA